MLNDPLIQIAMPELPETSAHEWDTENFKPTVIYLPANADLDVVTHLPAIDGDGNSIQFDITKHPTEPIIIISHNERLMAIPKNSGNSTERTNALDPCLAQTKPYFEDQKNIYYFKADYYASCGGGGGFAGGGGGSTGPVNTTCDRDRKSTQDHIKKVRFTSMKLLRKAEKWAHGNPELYFVVTFGSKEPSGFSTLRKYIPSTDRSQWKNCNVFRCVPEWYGDGRNGMPLPVFYWDESFYGDRVRYDWFEEDFSTTKVEYTAGLTVSYKEGDTNVNVSGQGKYTISDEDLGLGQAIVRYCDNTDFDGTLYTTGRIDWYVNQQ